MIFLKTHCLFCIPPPSPHLALFPFINFNGFYLLNSIFCYLLISFCHFIPDAMNDFSPHDRPIVTFASPQVLIQHYFLVNVPLDSVTLAIFAGWKHEVETCFLGSNLRLMSFLGRKSALIFCLLCCSS